MPIDPLDFGDEFQPAKRLAVPPYALPTSVSLESGTLLFGESSGSAVRPTLKTFLSFLNLSAASDEEILAFAKKWGPLGIIGPFSGPDWRTKGESCDEWRRLARIAYAVLEVGRCHNEGGKAAPEDWQTLVNDDCAGPDVVFPPSKSQKQMYKWNPYAPGFRTVTDREMGRFRETHGLGLEKETIQDIVNVWLIQGRVRPSLVIKGQRYELSLQANRLFGALAVQLLEMVGRYVIAACSGCRKFYRPTIKLKSGEIKPYAPKAGQDRFCQKCRDAGVPVARAMHRRNLNRAKERKEKAASEKAKLEREQRKAKAKKR